MYPPWSYSQSRANTFDECLRKYYFHYYGSHNGWNRELASEEQATLYRLKQLSNLYLLFGDLAHRMCESAVRTVDERREPPRQGFLDKVIREMLNQGYKESQDREAWIRQPKQRLMLSEIYYGEEALRDRISIINDRRRAIVRNLYTSAAWKELSAGGARVVEAEKWDTMLLHDTKVYVKMDLLYRRQNGEMVIVDWKTGKEGDFSDQLYLYASYVREKYNIPLEQLELRVEYLVTGECETYKPVQEDIAKVEENVGRYIEEMKSCLDDEYYNRPKPMSFFTPMPSRRTCGSCNFREVCEFRYV
ncbi:PD-(D/E)XK nuclease family protein [Paenibacillus sp. P96]|uniref:PD-(D/E)XK nuclease family protein n=2 Tax=Paenibacillus zeirhizosphaerae TaxID=2987519 RepID=A0ABT9FX22_9BACL|nr:PD-(D/E)XK nuclease family protein [Paenibacillus sp. P96]MDP4099056.1 PD-(D/E)XK nuclease family protein [Paenibacillus sp. P96]